MSADRLDELFEPYVTGLHKTYGDSAPAVQEPARTDDAPDEAA